MSKTLVLIPGFGETTKEKPYKAIKDYAKSVGYTDVLQINPIWEYKTMSNWYNDAKKQLESTKKENVTIAGFSFGAYIALLLSKDFSFKKSLYCSLSPYFSEHLNHIPEAAKSFLGKRRINDFKKYNMPNKLLTLNNIFLFGNKDWPYAIKEASKYSSKQKSDFILIKDTAHELNREYLDTIFKLLK